MRRLPPEVDRGDLIAAGMAGAWQTLTRHGHKPPDEFAKLVRSRIRGAILDELRAEMHKTRRAPDAPIFVELEQVARKLGADDPSFEELERHQELVDATGRLAAAMAQLPERERELLELSYFDGVKQADLAKRWGVSAPRISQLHRQALGRLRQLLGGVTGVPQNQKVIPSGAGWSVIVTVSPRVKTSGDRSSGS